MNLKKKLLIALSIVSVMFTLSAAPNELPEMPFAQTYDLFQPDGISDMIWVAVDGNLSTRSRVSFIRGKKPANLEEQDANGVPVVYLDLNFTGGEESRAFCLAKWLWHPADDKIKPTREWTCYVINFIPRLDGKVRFCVHPESCGLIKGKRYPTLKFVQIANVSAEGIVGKLKDPTFPKEASATKCWNYQPYTEKDWRKALPPKVIKQDDTTGPIPGGTCLRTVRNISQEITVKKDKQVTIRFYMRSDDMFKPKY